MWHRFLGALSGLLLCLLSPAWSFSQGASPGTNAVSALSIAIDAALTPVAADSLDKALRTARERSAAFVLLRLDTPGGSVDVMRRMVKSIRQSPVPVAVWVGPAGARAASAGVFLVAASPVAAMAPQTTIGSASPVGFGGEDLDKTMDAKIRNDLTSLVRSLAEATGRNADWYQRSVTSAANVAESEAVRERVVDFLAVSPEDYAQQLGKRGLPTPEGLVRFSGSQVRFEAFEAGVRHRLLSWLLDPQVAYVLLLVGVAGLFFELTTPGAILPGVIGGLCLLPALYALSILPTNAAGLLLLVFGGALFLLEIHVTSYGLLGLAGLAALFTGSLLLFDTPGADPLSLGLVAPTVIGVSLILACAGWMLAKAQRQGPRTGLEAFPGQVATVRHWQGAEGKVFLRGELWEAAREPAAGETVAFVPGDTVRVVAVQGMRLLVAPTDNPSRPNAAP